MQQVVCDSCAAQKGAEKSNQADDRGLFPFCAKAYRIQFGAGEKGQDDGSGAGKERDPIGFRAQPLRTHDGSDSELGHSTDHDFRQRG
jgi:hypothetical protein